MKATEFLSHMDRLKKKVSLYRFGMLCLVAVSLFNLLQSSACLNDKTVILVPPASLTEQARVNHHRADGAYLRMMARYVTGLAFTFTPSTVQGQLAELLELYHADAYADARKVYEDMAMGAQTANLTQSFHPKKEIAVQEDLLTLKGVILQTLNATAQPPKEAELKIRYRIEAGRFFILEMWNEQEP